MWEAKYFDTKYFQMKCIFHINAFDLVINKYIKNIPILFKISRSCRCVMRIICSRLLPMTMPVTIASHIDCENKFNTIFYN